MNTILASETVLAKHNPSKRLRWEDLLRYQILFIYLFIYPYFCNVFIETGNQICEFAHSSSRVHIVILSVYDSFPFMLLQMIECFDFLFS